VPDCEDHGWECTGLGHESRLEQAAGLAAFAAEVQTEMRRQRGIAAHLVPEDPRGDERKDDNG
jgi:hypothetical protein